MTLTEKDFSAWLTDSHKYTGGIKGLKDGVLYLSATDFCKSPQGVRLNIAYKDMVPPLTVRDTFRANVGTILHSSFEKYFREKFPHAILEERRDHETVIDGRTVCITGQVDMIYEGQLYDLKTRSSYSEGKDHNFAIQGSIYRHLLFGDILTEPDLVLVNLWHDWKDNDQGPTAPITLEHVPLMDKNGTLAFVENWLREFWNPDSTCSDEQRWMTPTTYAVMKQGAKRATKVYEDRAKARAECPPGSDVVVRQGQPRKCENYCRVRDFCPQYNKALRGEQDDRKPRQIL